MLGSKPASVPILTSRSGQKAVTPRSWNFKPKKWGRLTVGLRTLIDTFEVKTDAFGGFEILTSKCSLSDSFTYPSLHMGSIPCDKITSAVSNGIRQI